MRKIELQVSSSKIKKLSYQLDAETPDFLIEWFNDWLQPYVQDIDALQNGQYLQLGFSFLKIKIAGQEITIQSPNFSQFPTQWENDLYPALHVVTQHKHVPQNYGFDMDIPGMFDTAIVGERFGSFPMFLTRSEKESESNHSGWFIASLADDVDNTDEQKLKIMSLYEAVVTAPYIVSYLSMPVSCQIVFEESLPVVLHRNQVLEGNSNLLA